MMQIGNELNELSKIHIEGNSNPNKNKVFKIEA
jgi:hypothetical protein